MSDVDPAEAVTADGPARLPPVAEARELPVSSMRRLVMRLSVPGYEAAFPLFDEALDRGVVEPSPPRGDLDQNRLRELISYVTDPNPR